MAASEFDGGVLSRCVNGAPVYVGITLMDDGISGTETTITQQEYIDYCIATGATQHLSPCSVSSGGAYQPHSPAHKLVLGGKFTSATQSLSKTLKVPASTELQAIQLQKFRPIFLMILRNNGVRVYNPNNIYEIAAKIADLYPTIKSPSNTVLAAVSSPAFRKKNGMTAKSTGQDSGGFDIGGIVGGIVDLIGGIAGGIANGNVNDQLAEWAQNFTTYMATDIAAIRADLQTNGAQKALEKLLGYKNGSWAEMKNTITQFCADHGANIPNAYQVGWDQQAALEAEIRGMLGGTGGGDGGDNNSGGSNGIPGQMPSWVMPLIIFIGVCVVAYIAYTAFSKKKRTKTAAAA